MNWTYLEIKDLVTAMNYNLSASNFSQYETFLLLLQSRNEKEKRFSHDSHIRLSFPTF